MLVDSVLNEVFSFQRADDQVASYPVAINPDLVSRLESCLQELNLQPVVPRFTADAKEINLMVRLLFPG